MTQTQTTQTYRVILRGPVPGVTEERVAEQLAQRFKLTVEQSRALLSKPRVIIKTGLDLQTAATYQAALEQRGCACLVEPDVDQQRLLDIDASALRGETPERCEPSAAGAPNPAEAESRAQCNTEKPYYAVRFAAFDAVGGAFKPTWNWASFLFGVFWYFYKGLWAKGALMLALMALLFGMPAPFFWLYAALAGNYDYYLLRRRGTQFWSRSGAEPPAVTSVPLNERRTPTATMPSASWPWSTLKIVGVVIVLGISGLGSLSAYQDYRTRHPTLTPTTSGSAPSTKAPGSGPSTSSTHATARAAPTKSDIVGTWLCQTQNPNGSISQDTFTFSSDGRFETDGSGTYAAGVYEKNGDKVAMTAKKVSNGSITMATNRAIDGTITVLSGGKLQFESVMRRSGNKRSHSCTSTAVPTQEAASAPSSSVSTSRPKASGSETASAPKEIVVKGEGSLPDDMQTGYERGHFVQEGTITRDDRPGLFAIFARGEEKLQLGPFADLPEQFNQFIDSPKRVRMDCDVLIDKQTKEVVVDSTRDMKVIVLN